MRVLGTVVDDGSVGMDDWDGCLLLVRGFEEMLAGDAGDAEEMGRREVVMTVRLVACSASHRQRVDVQSSCDDKTTIHIHARSS